jgi:MoaA/NifB/PqqE/SkfB family radical SAM enzyme
MNYMVPELRLIHLQLTKNCNLRCSFCGQWGDQGYMKASTAEDVTTEQWLDVVAQAVTYRAETGISPQFILWGGEPLASPSFSAVSSALRDAGFTTALITNGVVIERNLEAINRNIDTVYVSLDGPPEVHERVRGAKGIFPRILRGLAGLDPAVMRVCLFTLCGENYQEAVAFPFQLGPLGFNRVIYQNLIYCTSGQAADYRRWMHESFGQEAPRLTSWISDTPEPWMSELPRVASELQANICAGVYPLEVQLKPGELNAENILHWYDSSLHLKKDRSPCLMPFRHLQINHDGIAHFCVDFNDFSLGNIKDQSLLDLFNNDRARRFREEGPTCNSLCARCPWYYNDSLKVDGGTNSGLSPKRPSALLR